MLADDPADASSLTLQLIFVIQSGAVSKALKGKSIYTYN